MSKERKSIMEARQNLDKAKKWKWSQINCRKVKEQNMQCGEKKLIGKYCFRKE